MNVQDVVGLVSDEMVEIACDEHDTAYGCGDTHQQAMRAALTAALRSDEFKRLVEDAERYRWLRAHVAGDIELIEGGEMSVIFPPDGYFEWPAAAFDAAIDAARNGSKPDEQ